MFKHFLALLGVGSVLLSAAAAQHFPISGVHTGINNKTGARPMRRNIDDFQKDTPAWYKKKYKIGQKAAKTPRSLYIQALIAMQQMPEDDQFSWFQISGTVTCSELSP
jgi:tyrosinase